MLVSNHIHSVKRLLFSSARPHDFDGMLGTGLLVSTTEMWVDNRSFAFEMWANKMGIVGLVGGAL
jgi:hypothetical protein